MSLEYKLAEKPCLEGLYALGYNYLDPASHHEYRDGDNNVPLRPLLIDAICRINGVPEEVARAVYQDLLGKTSNEEWLAILRGNYSRTVPGETTKKTLRLIDFMSPSNNTFTVTRQFYVKAQKSRKPDIVVFINGIPIVVIEAKSPTGGKDKSGQAFDQIKQYERDIPRLFYPNAFNIVTDGIHFFYGATGAPSVHWAAWRDPWPKREADFGINHLAKGLYALLEPSRLLDILAHFIVFERREEQVIKKICRFQQFRAANRMVERIIEGKHRRGLIWHTQGSGKSLTMVFATLKLKTHRTLQSPQLESPNILVLTDRKDLDGQLSGTFTACGLPNPTRVNSVKELRELISQGSDGWTLLSTIFKFEGSRTPIPNSKNWIVLVDECHRTQEQDLGAYLRATLPDARFFGFTGTPIKKTDKDTYANFGIAGETYLDKYGIDDAVADGATVPIYYMSRKTEWHVEAAKLDVLFDQWFADEPEERLAEIKKRGVTYADLVKHPKRIELIAYDIWTHYKQHALPDGFKAQVVAYDREAVVLYKRALDKAITAGLVKDGVPPEEAEARAGAMSACVYSANQEDDKPSEDPYQEALRADLRRYYLDQDAETDAKDHFGDAKHPLRFLIVCNKLLTGFDAPLEAVMYLDSPLKEHGLLQAIARTNRVAPGKKHGLIVDYIGVSKHLDKALASYRAEDVEHAMQDLDQLRAELKDAHTEVLVLTGGMARHTADLKGEYDALAEALGTEDAWFTFRRKARAFISVYSALAPDPAVLAYTKDLKWITGFVRYATQVFEKRESFDHLTYSQKIRQMLEEHLDVTGLRMVCKLRGLTEPEFWYDFKRDQAPQELVTAAIRKATELKKITSEKVSDNPLQYGPFSERVLALIRQFEQNQLDAAGLLQGLEVVAKDLQAEDLAYEASGLPENAYGIFKILEAFPAPAPPAEAMVAADGSSTYADAPLKPVEEVALAIDALYASEEHAPPRWQEKEQLRKELRQRVRDIAFRAGFKELREIPARVEEFALKRYART